MNDDLVALLIKQVQRYPGMEVSDAVKLIYQNEMGPGHLVKSEADSLQRLEDELASTLPSSTLFEDIGNDLCRLHLGALKEDEISLATVNRFFLRTANSHQGSIPALEEKLTVLVKACRNGLLPFPISEVEDFIRELSHLRYPATSHSKQYRRQYAPAYRVVRLEYSKYFPLFAAIDALLKTHSLVNVAIDGMSGSGKSTLAALLEQIYDCNVFHMDDFFLPQAMKTEERLAEPGGNVHYERFVADVMAGLATGEPFSYQPFDCQSQTLAEAVRVVPKTLNIVEGAYSLHPSLADTYKLKVFLHIDPREQNTRILQRNGPVVHERFMQEWVPLENRYFQENKIKDRCDLVFP